MNRLKEMRKKNHLTQVQIATMLSVRQNTYSYWESGKTNPDISCLQKLAEYYGVTVDYLIGRDVPDTDVGDKQTKKEPAADDSGLAEYKKQLIDALSSASPDDIRRMLEIARLVMGNRPV